MSLAAKRHLTRVAALGCALCNRIGHPETPAEIHHLRKQQGMSQRGSDWLAIGLCPGHHRGKRGAHGDRSDFLDARVDEMDLLADTIQKLYG